MLKIPQNMIAGTTHKTNNCGILTVVNYFGAKNVEVKFESGYKTTTQADYIRKGRVRDLLYPTVFGVGFVGCGEFEPSSIYYQLWGSMLSRCYSEFFASKRPTYNDCTAHPDWHNFQNFAKWCKENHKDDHQLDKDLLHIGNKTYAPDLCVFVPLWLNCFTLDRKSSRGEWPIGVSLNKIKNMFTARCSNNGKAVRLGYYSTPEAAHLAWRKYKLALALDKKSAMDAIDLRIYPNVVQIITEAR